MFKAKVIFVISFLAIAGIVLALLISSSSNGSKPVVQVTQAQKIVLYGYNDGENLAWRVRANKGTLRKEESHLLAVEVSFYTEEEEEFEVTAETLAFATTQMTLSGQVTASHRDGYNLQVQTLTWTEASNELAGNNIKLSSDKLTLSAIEFLYKLESRQAFLDGDIRVHLLSPLINKDDEGSSPSRQEGIELGTLEAKRALLTDAGMTAYENVRLTLYPCFFGASDGT